MTKLFVYASPKGGSLIASAGCNKPSDFNFDALLSFALHKFGKGLAA